MRNVDEELVLTTILYYPKVRKAVEIVARAKEGAKGDNVHISLDANSDICARFLFGRDGHEDYHWLSVSADDVAAVLNGDWGFRI